jgi:hypothetical protein
MTNLSQRPANFGRFEIASLDMKASSQAEKHSCASEDNTIKVLTRFFRRISVREGVIQILSQDYFRPEAAQRAWISSSISVADINCFSNCTSLTSVTFESNSKLQRIEESAFEKTGLRTIQIPATVEVL